MVTKNLLNNPFNNLKLKEVCERINKKHIEISKFDESKNYHGQYYYSVMPKYLENELEALGIKPNLDNKNRLIELATLYLDKFQV